MRHACSGQAAPRARRIGSRRHGIGVAAAAAALAGSLLAGAAQAQTLAPWLPAGKPLPAAGKLAPTGRAAPTPAWVDFCRRLPAECTIDEAEPTAIALTPEVWT